ncbi:MerR family transcriptional regulator [Planosporangium sp. 12N6]|uniref:MerR family transcriptional regulator n=1 Tax=Planosporangium spinosum TaxID=3402278 RepID=UPI003CF9D6EC
MWTLDELLDRVRAALAAEYPGAPNGRVRDVPDRRAVRWYATTGLVDRPAAMRGRHALYGQRHLLQLVAVKRRQAEGHSLARIQAELAGATDDTLAAIARVPEDLFRDGAAAPPAAPRRARFWTATPAADAAAQTVDAAPVVDAVPPVVDAAPVVDAVPPVVDAAPVVDAGPSAPDGAAATLAGVPLGGGVVLLLPVHPGPHDLAAIAAAAQPLLDLLADRGLLRQPHP